VFKFESVTDDEILCASALPRWTCSFVYPSDSCQATEIKARWGRARRLYGPHVTHYVIEPPKNLYTAFVCQLFSRVMVSVGIGGIAESISDRC